MHDTKLPRSPAAKASLEALIDERWTSTRRTEHLAKAIGIRGLNHGEFPGLEGEALTIEGAITAILLETRVALLIFLDLIDVFNGFYISKVIAEVYERRGPVNKKHLTPWNW